MRSVHHLSVRRAYQLGGASLLLAGTTILMGIITAEALRPPGYSTAGNDISDLGVAIQPSATLFNVVMGVSSILLLVGAYGVYRATHSRAASIPLALLGIGVLGVALFPGYPDSKVHVWVALLAFVAGGVAALLASRITTAPFRYLSLVLGAIALVSLVLAETHILTGPLGFGGAERWIVYPTVLWLVGFGGYLLGTASKVSEPPQGLATGTSITAEPVGPVEQPQ